MNQIFKDLATMVHEQGEVIDSIEANVESSHMNVGQGVQQLAKASDYQVGKAADGVSTVPQTVRSALSLRYQRLKYLDRKLDTFS